MIVAFKESEFYEVSGIIVRKIRTDHQLSLRDLAIRLAVNPTRLWRLDNGKACLNVPECIMIGITFNIDVQANIKQYLKSGKSNILATKEMEYETKLLESYRHGKRRGFQGDWSDEAAKAQHVVDESMRASLITEVPQDYRDMIVRMLKGESR